MNNKSNFSPEKARKMLIRYVAPLIILLFLILALVIVNQPKEDENWILIIGTGIISVVAVFLGRYILKKASEQG
jgi:lipopolysaccharide export LptBFGC system permease protein LptF